jgi:hypothetical protein
LAAVDEARRVGDPRRNELERLLLARDLRERLLDDRQVSLRWVDSAVRLGLLRDGFRALVDASCQPFRGGIERLRRDPTGLGPRPHSLRPWRANETQRPGPRFRPELPRPVNGLGALARLHDHRPAARPAAGTAAAHEAHLRIDRLPTATPEPARNCCAASNVSRSTI